MKRKILSMITTLALCLGLLPGAVSAAEKSMQGIEAVTTMLNFADAEESMSGPGYTWDYETKTLTLENFYQDYTDTSTGTDAIRLPETTDDVTIILKGSNTIKSWSFGIGRGFVGVGVTEVPGSLTIKGSGTLTFEANTAIDVNGTLRIESGELNVRNASSKGIGSYYEDVVITGGILDIESGGSTTAGIFAANGNVVIQGGSIQAVNSGDCGIAGDQGVAISGGQVTVETDGYPGIASLNGKVEISGRAEITSTSQNHRALFGKSGVILSDDRIRDISVNTEASANGAAAWDKTTALNSYKYVKIVPAPVSVTDVQLDKDTLTLQAGETAQLTVSITPVDADDQSVLWTSSNTAVAMVDASGNVTAVSAGTTTITVTTTDGAKTATCTVTVRSNGGTTTPSKPGVSVDGEGGTAVAVSGSTVTITPDKGYRIEKVTVNSKEVDIPADGKLTGLKPSDKVVVTFSEIFPQLTDVKSGAWYYDAVKYAVDRGLFYGTSDTAFSPDATMTRGMLTTVLHRMAGEPETDADVPFTDLRNGSYYEKAVRWAYSNGIVAGRTETSFAPDEPITRQELATLLYHYSGGSAEQDSLTAFKDSEKISGYARPALCWAVESGIVSGKGNGILDPLGKATRAETASMLKEFLTESRAT